jgi:hypothetical protein
MYGSFHDWTKLHQKNLFELCIKRLRILNTSIPQFCIFTFPVVCRSLTSMCSAPLRGVSDTIIAMNDNEQPGKYATMKRGKGRRDAPDAR